jgi:iron(II)-dependent oxidoreductase
MEMIPGGRFTLGGGPTPESKPKNKNASSDPFVLDRYKVSNAQYLQFVQATGSKAPDGWKDGVPDPQKSEFAVSGISYQDAVTYCRWIGKRLPDEFEWEKAARGPGALDFPYEDAGSKDRKAYNPFQEYPVNRWPVLASPYKVEGMHTSLWEWTSSWFAPYPGNDESSVLNVPRDTFKVVRGGSRSSTFAGIEKPLEVTARDRRPPNRREADVGFRCASQTSEAPSWLNDEPQPEKVREPAAAGPASKSGN